MSVWGYNAKVAVELVPLLPPSGRLQSSLNPAHLHATLWNYSTTPWLNCKLKTFVYTPGLLAVACTTSNDYINNHNNDEKCFYHTSVMRSSTLAAPVCLTLVSLAQKKKSHSCFLRCYFQSRPHLKTCWGSHLHRVPWLLNFLLSPWSFILTFFVSAVYLLWTCVVVNLPIKNNRLMNLSYDCLYFSLRGRWSITGEQHTDTHAHLNFFYFFFFLDFFQRYTYGHSSLAERRLPASPRLYEALLSLAENDSLALNIKAWFGWVTQQLVVIKRCLTRDHFAGLLT